MNEDNEKMKDLCKQLSLNQMKEDCRTIIDITKYINGNSVMAMGLNPYLSVMVAAIMEIFDFDKDLNIENKGLPLDDLRLKAKLFENGYSKSKRMILNIDYLQDECFKRRLKFKFLRSIKANYNLGIYANSEKHIVFNTQLVHYALQDSRFLKRRYEDVAEAYNESPEKFDFIDNSGKLMYEHGMNCGELIAAAYISLGGDISINTLKEQEKNDITLYVDYNTNRKSELFPDGETSKAIRLFLLHTLSTINFSVFGLKPVENNDTGWWLKTYYIAYYYTVRKLQDLYNHLVQNGKMTEQIQNYYTLLDLEKNKFMNSEFRNYAMHSSLINKQGKPMILNKLLNLDVPLYGLVESCFDGLDYNTMKKEIIKESKKISAVLETWLEVDKMKFKSL